MSTAHETSGQQHQFGHYAIRLKGHLDVRQVDWFDGLSVTHENDGTTILTAAVTDQAALHGLLRKVRDLGLLLIAVNRVEPNQANGQDVNMDTDHNRCDTETRT